MHKINRLLLFGSVIMALLVAMMPTFPVSAALVKCRTDPKFMLSNGDKVTVVLDIDTAEANVIAVKYIVHVPAGVTLKNVVFTAGGIGQTETYQILQDSPRGTYTTETFLLTRQAGVAFVATTSLGNKILQSVSSYSSQNLTVAGNSITAVQTTK